MAFGSLYSAQFMEFNLLIDANDSHCVMIGCVVDTDVDLIVEVVDIEVVGVVVVDD
jgi:Asp/Glu/hydantoin racemase